MSLRNVEEAGVKPTRSAHAPNRAGSADEVRPPLPDERVTPENSSDSFGATVATIALAAAIAAAVVVGFHLPRSITSNFATNKAINVKAIVDRIIIAESGDNPNLRNKLSSATGAGQFLDDTWLEAVRRHRRDLIKGRSDIELLKLRRDAELTREIVARMVEQYVGTLQKRGLAVTPGSIYLAYFAGPAGAVALLSGAEDADAASLMAAADVTGRTTRQKLVKANPFLQPLTAGKLKTWADHKMQASPSGRNDLVLANRIYWNMQDPI
jgi:hypothetical protein